MLNNRNGFAEFLFPPGLLAYASNFSTTSPDTSVRRKSRP
jgi:hypothetical protein